MRPATPEGAAQAVGMATLIAIGAAVLAWRGMADAAGPDLDVVEVRGEVPAPGFYALPSPVDVQAALLAAGVASASPDPRPLRQGQVLTLEAGEVDIGTSDAALTLGQPLDLNEASVVALEQLPGVGPSRAAAIAEDRARQGPFRSVDELDRVKGFGPATVERLRPYLVVGPTSHPAR